MTLKLALLKYIFRDSLSQWVFIRHLVCTEYLARSWKDKDELDIVSAFGDSSNKWAERPVNENPKQRNHLQ